MTEVATLILFTAVNATLVGAVLCFGLAQLRRFEGGAHARVRYLLILAAMVVSAAPAILAGAPGDGAVVATPSAPGLAGGLLDELARVAAWPMVIGYSIVTAILIARELLAAFRGAVLADEVRKGRATEALGPCALGLLRPVVVAPNWARDAAGAAWPMVERHEQNHLVWRDPLARLAIRLTAAVFWPVAPIRLLARMAIDEQERAADDAALGPEAGPETRETYVAAMSRLGAGVTPRAAAGQAGDLRRRSARLLSPRRSGRVVAIATIALSLLVLAAALIAPRLATDAGRPGPGVHLPEDDVVHVIRRTD